MRGPRQREKAREPRHEAGPREVRPAPIPLEPVDLLAGLAPGVELHADDVPPGVGGGGAPERPAPATTTVADAGKLVRAGEGAIRRLIRSTVLRPRGRGRRDGAQVDRAGVLPPSRERPGE